MNATLAPRPGSSLYYSLIRAPEEARGRFLQRLTALEALARTLDDVSDAGVAQQKVHWWHEEIERVGRDAARHPAMQAVGASLAGSKSGRTALLDVLAVAADHRFTPPATDAIVATRARRAQGARLALLSHALSSNARDLDSVEDALSPLLLAAGAHDDLAQLPRRLASGLAVFSVERYSAFGLTPDKLREIASHQRMPLLADAVEQARIQFDRAMRDIDCQRWLAGTDREPLRCCFYLRAAQVQLWHRTAPDLIRERTTLTPIRKWFIAFRTSRSGSTPDRAVKRQTGRQ